MDSSSIELPGSEIESITLEKATLRIHFTRANIIQTMTGSAERTRWSQAGDLLIEGAKVEGELPSGPLVSAGGDLVDNVYTYRDMLPIPLQSHGLVRCDFKFRETDMRLVAQGKSVELIMIGVPKYIEHLRT